jgi:hypothetical protein
MRSSPTIEIRLSLNKNSIMCPIKTVPHRKEEK